MHPRPIIFVCLVVFGMCLLGGCRTMAGRASLRRDINSMIDLLEQGAWEEMAERYVVPSDVEESKNGLKVQRNRQLVLAVLKEFKDKEAEFSSDGRCATFRIEEEDIPPQWRFEKVGRTWRIADVN